MWISEKQLLIVQKGLDLPVFPQGCSSFCRCLCSALFLLPDIVFFISEEKGEDTLHTLSQDKDIQRLLRIPTCLKASLLLNKAFRYVSYLDEAE